MNCRNCGAAMTLVAGRDYFRCDYCLSFHFPAGTGEDGVHIVGGTSGLACPVCREPLKDGRVEGEPVQYCPRCRGFLTGNASFSNVVRERRLKRPAGINPHGFDPTELKRVIDCPRCEKRMDTHPYYGGGRVVVDTCPRCALIWLDAGELTVIERHNPRALVSNPSPPPAIPLDDGSDLLATFMGWRIEPW